MIFFVTVLYLLFNFNITSRSTLYSLRFVDALHFLYLNKVERSVSYNEHRPRRPPPDLPSLLLHGRIIYIGMPVSFLVQSFLPMLRLTVVYDF